MSEQPVTLRTALWRLDRILTRSSKDWGEYWADAWLYGILVGWECEEEHVHDDVCGGDSALREIAAKHHLADETVQHMRECRAAVRAVRAVPVRPGEETTT